MDTRSRLIEEATHIVRTRGYSAFSYADLAEVVGIRKPSIHHHFPTKEDLGVALIEHYTDVFMSRLEHISRGEATTVGRLRGYSVLYDEAFAAGEACLCGMLASEVANLPASMRAGVLRFLNLNRDWIRDALQAGEDAGKGGLHADFDAQATNILGLLQGALFVARAMDSREPLQAAARQLGL